MSNPKINRRVQYTKMVLQKSLLDLMETQPIHKITVTDICNLADVNRGTFYAHYSDPHDLLVQIEQELYEALCQSLGSSFRGGMPSALIAGLVEIIAQNGELFRVLFSEYGDREFIRKLVYIAHDSSTAEWQSLAKDVPATRLEALYAYIAHGSAGVIENWVRAGMQESSREIAELIEAVSLQALHVFLPA